MTKNIYQEDLAHIHIEGFGFHWEQAAPAVLAFLRQHNIDDGTVVDLGCGGGQWLDRLASHGYDVCGVDISPSMIRAAKRRIPSARFILGSIADVDLPRCDAVTSFGEPINYLDGQRSIRRVFRNVFRALRSGGLFVFDACEPAKGPIAPRFAGRFGDTWACIAEIKEDEKTNTLIRDISTFRRIGKNYRRASELHQLKIYPKRDTLRWLRRRVFESARIVATGIIDSSIVSQRM